MASLIITGYKENKTIKKSAVNISLLCNSRGNIVCKRVNCPCGAGVSIACNNYFMWMVVDDLCICDSSYGCFGGSLQPFAPTIYAEMRAFGP